MNDFPPELRFKPTPLVALSGASKDLYSVIENATSTTVQEAQRACPIFRYQSIIAKDFAVPARNDKEKPLDYIPEGILPTGWFTSVAHKIPCAVVHLVEYDAPDFKIREHEHCANIETLRFVSPISTETPYHPRRGHDKMSSLHYSRLVPSLVSIRLLPFSLSVFMLTRYVFVG